MDPFGNDEDIKNEIIPKNKNNTCPTKKEWMEFIAPLPEEFELVLQKLRKKETP